MSGIAAAVEELLVAMIVSEKVLLPRKNVTDWALTVLAVLLGIGGVFLSVLGLDRFLEGRYPPDMAALISAVFVFIMSFLAAALAYHFRRRKISVAGTARNEIGKNIRTLIDDICGELEEPVRESPKTAVMLAALAGFLVPHQRT
jgi:hypothetical protein